MNYVELNALLKAHNISGTGGQAKLLIQSGEVKVNGVSETKNKRKLVAGDVVEVKGKIITVLKEECRQEK